MKTYFERAKKCINKTAVSLLHLIEEKKTNLSVSADVITSQELLNLADTVGSEICVLKTHIDIIKDFSSQTINQLQVLAKKYNFLIFEDRKFADIGNTVKLQYAEGIYKIADWAHITNAHTVPGPGIIQGLKEIGLAKGNGLLLLAEMSSKGTLAFGEYTQKTIQMAQDNSDFVIGFITRQRLVDDPNFINMTPGIQLESSGDNLGQQYLTPTKALIENQTDIIIVGRGIYQSSDPRKMAQKYRNEGWKAYLKRIK